MQLRSLVLYVWATSLLPRLPAKNLRPLPVGLRSTTSALYPARRRKDDLHGFIAYSAMPRKQRSWQASSLVASSAAEVYAEKPPRGIATLYGAGGPTGILISVLFHEPCGDTMIRAATEARLTPSEYAKRRSPTKSCSAPTPALRRPQVRNSYTRVWFDKRPHLEDDPYTSTPAF